MLTAIRPERLMKKAAVPAKETTADTFCQTRTAGQKTILGPVNAAPYRGNTVIHNRLQVRFSDLRYTSRPLPVPYLFCFMAENDNSLHLTVVCLVFYRSPTFKIGAVQWDNTSRISGCCRSIAYSGATVSVFHRVPLHLRSDFLSFNEQYHTIATHSKLQA